MKPVNTVKRRSKGTTGPDRLSIRATWHAICRLPSDHFPLILPGVHPLASFFILRRLKHLGFSNCSVTTSTKGLVVHAHK